MLNELPTLAPLVLACKGKESVATLIRGVLFAIEDFTRRELHKNPEPLTCTSRLSVWVVPRNQSVAAAKPLDEVLIRKIRFGKKNIRTRPKIIMFDPREPNQCTRNEENFVKLCDNLQNCLPCSSLFLFHDLKSKCAGTNEQSTSASNKRQGQLYVASNLCLKGIAFIVYFGEEMPIFKEKFTFETNWWHNSQT